jgi:hypothetical protein
VESYRRKLEVLAALRAQASSRKAVNGKASLGRW